MSDANTELTGDVRARRASNGHGHLPQGFWAADGREYDDQISQDEQFDSERYPGIVNLNFLRLAIKRKARLWCAFALVGLLAGLGLFVARPAGYQATIKLLMTPYPGYQLGWINDDLQLAQTPAAAALALKKLPGVHETPAAFASTYTVATFSAEVLEVTVKAASPQEALLEAKVVARAILDLQNVLLTKKEQATINRWKKLLVGAHHDPALKNMVANNIATIKNQTQATITGSIPVPPPTLVVKSVKRRLAEYGGAGLIGGLALGLGIVIIGASASTRLRRRDDVARALAAPVRLSIRKRRLSPRRIRRRGLEAVQDRELARVSMHLASAVAPAAGGFASLAVVAIGNAEVAAASLASLALSSAQENLKVVMADLCDGAPAARLLGVDHPGVEEVIMGDTRLTVVMPDRDDLQLGGPLQAVGYGQVSDDPKLAACASADLVLSLATLDPALGGDHLAEWASSVVVVLTAGKSSAERIQAVGEMIRLAGIDQVSAVLVGADKSDESLGMPGTRVVTQASGSPTWPTADEDM